MSLNKRLVFLLFHILFWSAFESFFTIHAVCLSQTVTERPDHIMDSADGRQLSLSWRKSSTGSRGMLPTTSALSAGPSWLSEVPGADKSTQGSPASGGSPLCNFRCSPGCIGLLYSHWRKLSQGAFGIKKMHHDSF